MEFTYEKTNNRGKIIKRTIEVTPKFEDYLDFIETQADPGSFPWAHESAEKVHKIVKWLFDNGQLLEENFDDDDDFRDYLRDVYEDAVEWPWEPDPDEREY